MSQKNEIAVVIPDAELQNINNLIVQLKEAIAPYIHPLTSEEILSLLKMGDKTLSFVTKVKDYTTTNPEFVPNFMNVNDFVIDVNAVNTLAPIQKSMKQITADLNDTVILSGNESLIAALMYYNNVKFNASQGVAGAKVIYDDLKKRFPGRGLKTTSSTSA